MHEMQQITTHERTFSGKGDDEFSWTRSRSRSHYKFLILFVHATGTKGRERLFPSGYQEKNPPKSCKRLQVYRIKNYMEKSQLILDQRGSLSSS